MASYKVTRKTTSFLPFWIVHPMAKGHTCSGSEQEIDCIFDLDDNTLSDMIVFAKKTAKAIEKAIPCKRIGMIVIGLEVPHASHSSHSYSKESDMSLASPAFEIIGTGVPGNSRNYPTSFLFVRLN